VGNKPKKPIFTKFDGTNVPDDFDFPSIELEDIDRAVFDLFDKVISFETEEKGQSRKVPVIFATGERFALTRRKNPIRDKNNALILPLISIMRNEIDVSANQHGFKTAISYGDQPGYYIKKRLAKHDRNYQNIINKLGIKNQKNVSSRSNFDRNDISPGNIAKSNTVASRRNGKNNSLFDQNIDLGDNLGKNIYEIIEIPYPTFASVKYTAVFWSQYNTQANEMLQTLFRSFPGQAHEIPIKTTAGFELVIFFDDNFSPDTNFETYSDEERLIKYKINFTVPGYILNPKSMKGMPNQIRSYFSAPTINFGYQEPKGKVVFDNQPERKKSIDKFILSDIKNNNQISKDNKRGESNEDIEVEIQNPFGKKGEILKAKVLTRNKRSGETVLSGILVKNIENQYE
jgi:hypothetical protein